MPENNAPKNLFNNRGLTPHLTCFQICVLDSVGKTKRRGAEIREILESWGIKQSEQGFSAAMKTLERAGFIESGYAHSHVPMKRGTLREKFFERTRLGDKCFDQVQNFFETLRF